MFYFVSQCIAQWIYMCALRGRVYGVERVPLAGGVILASNHQSFFDPIIATLPVPREACYLGRDSL
ncbi:MAG TPA: 1-acyl-sn-glycerol-3-phosphate acyltransferase, partial [Phycisphaerae bacterium]